MVYAFCAFLSLMCRRARSGTSPGIDVNPVYGDYSDIDWETYEICDRNVYYGAPQREGTTVVTDLNPEYE